MHELIAPTINFVMIVAILVYFTRKPIITFVSSRHIAIKNQVEEAQLQKSEAERRYREFAEKLSFFEKEANATLERSRQEGETLKIKIIKDAHTTAERILKEAETTAQANVQEYLDQLRRETILKAVEMAERVVRERLSSEDQRRMVNEYVGKVQSP